MKRIFYLLFFSLLIYSCSSDEDTIKEEEENDMSTNIKNILGICSDKEDYENLKKYLLENIEDFGINNDGMKILLDKLNEEINVDNVGINYKILLDEINDLCIYLKNSY